MSVCSCCEWAVSISIFTTVIFLKINSRWRQQTSPKTWCHFTVRNGAKYHSCLIFYFTWLENLSKASQFCGFHVFWIHYSDINNTYVQAVVNKWLISVGTFSQTFFPPIIVCPITRRKNMLVCKYHVHHFLLISNEDGIIWNSLVNTHNIKCNQNPLNNSPVFTAKIDKIEL